MQTISIANEGALRFGSIGEGWRYSELLTTESDELDAILQSRGYEQAIRKYRVREPATLCAVTRFARIHHSLYGSAFEIPMETDDELPAPLIALFRLMDEIRSGHFEVDYPSLMPRGADHARSRSGRAAGEEWEPYVVRAAHPRGGQVPARLVD